MNKLILPFLLFQLTCSFGQSATAVMKGDTLIYDGMKLHNKQGYFLTRPAGAHYTSCFSNKDMTAESKLDSGYHMAVFGIKKIYKKQGKYFLRCEITIPEEKSRITFYVAVEGAIENHEIWPNSTMRY